jgi:hypothetical protein
MHAWPRTLSALLALAGTTPSLIAQGTDARVGLSGGHFVDASEAISNLELISHTDKPQGYYNPSDRGDLGAANTDIAFRDHYLFQGNGRGVLIWDIADPRHPTLVGTTSCPAGQGDISVYRNLLFVSTEGSAGRLDCGNQGVQAPSSPERMRGIRIYDVADVAHPKLVTNVQTCRGSHTNTVVPDLADTSVVYVYVQGISPVRPASELAGCSGLRPEEDPNTSLFRIEVIRVPLRTPEQAKVVANPRIFADVKTGAINGLAKASPGDTANGVQATAETNQCHDITAYPAIGLAAGACSGNGILLDIRTPANPKRVAQVTDPNFAYWHSANFSNDGKTLVFTDEWGGGFGAKCRASDPPKWGGDAIFSVGADRSMSLDSYYKLPAVQSEVENCVAHNGSLIPVPGRNILVQAWYQGGISIFDFTDPKKPKEIAYFDRGPLDASKLLLGGFWGAYWYNGHVYGSDIGRGLDIFDLKVSADLSQNEIEAARLVHTDISNPTTQDRIVWPATFVVARAYLDQLERMNGVAADKLTTIRSGLDAAEHQEGAAQRKALDQLAKQINQAATGAPDADRVKALASVVRGIGKGHA